ncbi:acyl-CoA N-acyltransferase [Gymnopilus junonius]|uniref:Acyl-CoA N-acyltransferase n=1 Tax=Gymnopilus junonius TaxID=109634 RepID=A0A9P5NNN1_GYMJU|nr:acyl-CoA N-acyltransferase [Gymnopilus junonius]
MFDLPKNGIRLRAFRQSDLDDILALHNDAEVALYATSGFAVPQGETRKESYKNNAEKAELFCVAETKPFESSASDKPEFIGIAALWPDQERGQRHSRYSITLNKKFWGRGYGSEITKFMVDYAFRNLNMHRISLGVIQGNDRALSIYKNCGFVLEGTQRKSNWIDGGWRDVYLMGMLIEDWVD